MRRTFDFPQVTANMLAAMDYFSIPSGIFTTAHQLSR